MAIDFPNSPSTNDTYTVGNKTWIYDGTTWNTYNSTTFSAETLPGTTIKSTVTGSSLTSVGTLTSLNVTGDVTVDTNTLKVDATNNRVGIGTASPQASLDVQAIFGTAMRITHQGSGDSFIVEDQASTDTTPFVIDANGNVGIGITSVTAAKLDVQVSSGTGVRITNTGTGNCLLVEDAAGDIAPFVINADGNVGMGVSNPLARLHISDGSANIRLNTSTPSADALNIVAPIVGANNRSLTLRPVVNMSASNTLELPNTTGEIVAFTSARGTNTAWTTFTSTITQLGNVTFTTQVSRYCQMGKTIHWQFSLACTGTGTINNAIRINLPQTAQANAIYSVFGTMHVYDASANTHYTGHAFAYSTTQAAMMLNAGTTYFQTIALTTSDIISGHIIYEAA